MNKTVMPQRERWFVRVMWTKIKVLYDMKYAES